jgi:hypothetical protein
MRHTSKWLTLALGMAAAMLVSQGLLAQDPGTQSASSAATVTATRHKSHKAKKELVLPPLPSGPLSQLPMDQIPASPARVSYEAGLLTISAQNSTLGEILRDVHRLTGAAIDMPQGSGVNERVVAHLGPGAPRDVLAGLLNGSSFNYVMVGSSLDPATVSSVILTTKPTAGGEAPTQTAANVYEPNPMPSGPSPMPPTRFPQPGMLNQHVMPQPGGVPPPNAEAASADDDSSADDQDAADDSADDQSDGQPAQPGQAGQPGVVGINGQTDPNQSTDPNQPNAGPRTPEQIMDMLRNRQQAPGSGTAPTPPQQQQQ